MSERTPKCGLGGLWRNRDHVFLFPSVLCHSSLVIFFSFAMLITGASSSLASIAGSPKLASWYGEEHRGKLMANGKRFNPDKFTAASWFYPLGTKVRVTLNAPSQPPRSVVVKVTDRGPAKTLVRDGRVIDLTLVAFKQLAHPDLGLIEVTVEPLR